MDVQVHEIHKRYPGIEIRTEQVSGGSQSGRTALASVLAEVKRTKGTLVVMKLDRLSRGGIVDVVSIADELAEAGAVLHVLEFGHEPQPRGAMPDMIRNLNASFGQFEKQVISERTKAALARLKAEGKQLGGARTPGFRADGTPTGKVLKPMGRKPSAHLNPARVCINRMLDADPNASTAVLAAGCDASVKFVQRVRRERAA